MLTASQDIDYFIERQRSKLNKPTRQQVTRQRPVLPPIAPPPPPPPPQPQFVPTNNLEDRLDFKVARILDEPLPRVQSEQQSYYTPSPRPLTSNNFLDQQSQSPSRMSNYFPEQESQRRYANDPGNNNNNDTPRTFFDRFGDHDAKRAQLKDDLKREYNEFLRSQQRGPKNRSTSQIATPRGNTTRRVQFQENGKVVAPWEKGDRRSTQNVQNFNDISSSSNITTTREYRTSRLGSRVAPEDEQYIRDREEYILELHDQIRELEARRRQLELGQFV
jgi:hypothetical protein